MEDSGQDCLQKWKKQFMFPFGDIAPINDFDKRAVKMA